MEPLTKADLLEALSAFATREELLKLFPTREELKAFPTREEVRQEIRKEIRDALEPYPTRVEVREEIQTALQPHATREEMRADLGASEEETRRHFRIVGEGLHDEVRLVAEGVAGLSQRVEHGFREIKTDLAMLDRRVTRLEARKA